MSVNYLIGGNSTLQNELLRLLGDKEAEEIKNIKIKGDDEGVKKDNENDANNTEDEDKVKIENVIKDAILDQKMEEAKYVNSEMSGGANIVGLVENILAGGNLNNTENPNEQVENSNESNSTEQIENSNNTENSNEQVENSNEVINEPEKKDKEAIVPGDEIIGNILIEGGNDISGGNSNNLKDIDDVDDEQIEENEEGEPDDHDEDGENELNDDDENEDENENDYSDDEDDNEVNDKYIKIISEMRDSNSNNHNNTSLSGGSVESAKRVKILNMFPWILKSSD